MKHSGTVKTPHKKWEQPHLSQNWHCFPPQLGSEEYRAMSLFCQLVFQVSKLGDTAHLDMQRVPCKSWKDSGSEVEDSHLIQGGQGSGSRFLQPDLIGIWLCIIWSENPGSLGGFPWWFCPGPIECFSTKLLYIFMWNFLVLTKIVLILQLEIQIVIYHYEFWQSTPPCSKYHSLLV